MTKALRRLLILLECSPHIKLETFAACEASTEAWPQLTSFFTSFASRWIERMDPLRDVISAATPGCRTTYLCSSMDFVLSLDLISRDKCCLRMCCDSKSSVMSVSALQEKTTYHRRSYSASRRQGTISHKGPGM